jgi:hypothetical protein
VECYPDTKYREVLVTFSLAGWGPRSCRSPGRFQRSLHMLYGRLSLRKYLCFHSEAQHGSHHVCDNRALRTSSSRRTALSDSETLRANPIQHMVMDIGSHCRLGLGSYVSPYLRTVRRYQSLFGESCYTVCAHRGVECSQVHAWTISSKTPTMANNNQRDDSGSGEQ